MARRRRSLADRYRSQAQAEAELRYAPEFRTLREIAQQAADARDASIGAARATGRGMRQSIAAIRPQVAATYESAGQRLANQNAAVTPRLDQLGPAADLIRAAAIAEQGAAQNALAAAQARNLSDLDSQRVRAGEGAAFARTQANLQFQQDLSKVARQMNELAGEKGAYTATALSKLVDSARDRSIDRARVRETERHNRQTETEARRKRREKEQKEREKKWATPAQQGAAQDKIATGVPIAKMLAPKLSRDKAARVLLTGDPASGIPKMSPLYASIALDLAYDGHISRRNVQELHKRRIKVRPLGFPTKPQRPPNRINTPGRPTAGRT